jgi:hypothetical protein
MMMMMMGERQISLGPGGEGSMFGLPGPREFINVPGSSGIYPSGAAHGPIYPVGLDTRGAGMIYMPGPPMPGGVATGSPPGRSAAATNGGNAVHGHNTPARQRRRNTTELKV